MYLQYQLSEKGVDKKTYIVFYSILIVYILSTAIIALDVARIIGEVSLSHNSAGTNDNIFIRASDRPVSLHDQYISADLERRPSRFDCVYHGRLRRLYLSNYHSKHKPVNHHDTHQSFNLPKSSKIYRCWIAWNRNIRVLIIPSIFTVTFFGQSDSWCISLEWLISIFQLLPSAIWIVLVISSDQWDNLRQNSLTAPDPEWPGNLFWTCLALSLTVNATMTGLIVFRIMKVYLEVKPTLSELFIGTTGSERNLRSIIFILMESGMALFAIQLGRLVLTMISSLVKTSIAADSILQPFVSIQQMLNVIIGPVIFTTYFTDSLCLARA